MVVLESNQITNKSLEKQGLHSLGKNNKKILILVSHENAVHLPDEELNFLMGILTACKLTMADIALLNTFNDPGINYQSLQKAFKPATLICFGIDLSTLSFPLEFPHYQLQKYNKQVFLSAPSLKKLSEDVTEKKQLWACLKTLFTL